MKAKVKPFRIGKKQKLALLTYDGIEVVMFKKGQEELADLVCKLLNNYYNLWE